jgi:tetratricopeptide (TPR) repeat protein
VPPPIDTTPSRRQHRLLFAGLAAAIALTSAGIGAYAHWHRPPILTDKDTLVLADFSNTTGDPVFDDTLRQGLSVQLSQSPFLSLVSDERIRKWLGLMGQPDARLTPDLARSVCQRAGSAAILEGSIASLGSAYVLGLRAKACDSGDVLAEEQAQAARKEDVLAALSHISSSFRARLGESLTTIQRHDRPLPEASTSSIEALKAYSAGLQGFHTAHDFPAAILHLQRASELDPSFAMPHAVLGLLYAFTARPALSAKSATEAYRLRDHASDPEKFFITATYDLQVTGNLERAQQTLESWVQTYPRDIDPAGLLGSAIYPTLGKYEKALEAAQRLIDLDPDFPVGYYQYSFNTGYLNRFAESGDAIARAVSRKLDMPEFALQRYDLAFIAGDEPGMKREAALATSAGLEDMVVARQAFVAAYSGHLQEAATLTRRAEDLGRQASQAPRVALYLAAGALRDAFVGNNAGARRQAEEAVGLAPDRDVVYGAALALALARESARALALASELESRFPEDTAVRSGYLPTIRAVVEIERGQPAKAIELLKSASAYEIGVPPCSVPPGFFGVLYPVYVRGLAYLAARQGREAAEEFRKIMDHRGAVVSDLVGALANLQLGRAFALSGDKQKAVAAYDDFFGLWKTGDAGVPILDQAKAEYARLR